MVQIMPEETEAQCREGQSAGQGSINKDGRRGESLLGGEHRDRIQVGCQVQQHIATS